MSDREISVHKVSVEAGECPSARSWHAAVCVDYGGSTPQLLVTGGWDNRNPVNDIWMLDVQTWKWKQVQCSGFYRVYIIY